MATDRRDQLQRATCISLLDDTFQLSGEKREQGVVVQLKDGFGFIRCVERSVRLFFHFTEVLDTSREICVCDEIEFTCVQDPTSSFTNPRLSAIRIKHLSEGSVKFENLIETGIEGVVTREAPKSPVKSQERTEGGVITYGIGNNKKTIMYFLKDCDKSPRIGDNVKFNICQVRYSKFSPLRFELLRLTDSSIIFKHCSQFQFNLFNLFLKILFFALTGQAKQGVYCDKHSRNLQSVSSCSSFAAH